MAGSGREGGRGGERISRWVSAEAWCDGGVVSRVGVLVVLRWCPGDWLCLGAPGQTHWLEGAILLLVAAWGSVEIEEMMCQLEGGGDCAPSWLTVVCLWCVQALEGRAQAESG